MSDGVNVPSIPGLTTEIVAAYVSHHGVATADFGRLVTAVAQELSGLGHEPEPPAGPEPAVPVRQSVQRDHLVCLVCGRPFKSLRRHLQNAHDLTPESYRAMFGLARDYPMVATASSEQRAAIARRSGLGQRHPPDQAPEPEAIVEPKVPAGHRATRGRKAKKQPEVAATEPQRTPKPVRGRRAAKQAAPASATDPARQPQPEVEPKPKPRRARRPKSDPTPP